MTKPTKGNAEHIKGITPAEAEEMYVSWDGKDITQQQRAFKAMSSAVDEYVGIATGSFHQDLSNLTRNVSGRPGLSRSDYENFRPDEATPVKTKAILSKANFAYQRVGLVRNVIDLMGDFGSQGIRLVHPNKRIEKFYRHWFEKVEGQERSERFLNYIYRMGNVVVRRQTAKVSLKNEKKLYKTGADTDLDILENKVPKKEIPWKYNFLDPRTVEVVGGPVANFVGNPKYALMLPEPLRKVIVSPKPNEVDIVNQLPPDIIEAAKNRKPYLLPEDKISVWHYKKDDWQTWALPMIYAILDDIELLDKLRLADAAALDGAISNVRIWQLGSLEHKIGATAAAVEKLAGILGNNTGAGTMDLIWGPDLKFTESNTNVHNFLGQAKYEPTLMAIYSGLGIPPTLTGTFGAAGTTNNFISLKTLTQRLQYGRNILIEFWNQEIAIVQQAMGFRFPAKVEFDIDNLGDEIQEKALLVQLADRNLISDELLQQRFKHDPEMERIRLNREHKDRQGDYMVPKSGPFHSPEFDKELKKVALQLGIVTPSEVGLELEPKKEGEKTALDIKGDQMAEKQKGIPGQGRPKNSNDKTKRKTKTFKPKIKAKSMELWATEAQQAISAEINPILLEHYGKSTLRALTDEEFNDLEDIKFSVLMNLEPFSPLTTALFSSASDSREIYKSVKNVYKTYIQELTSAMGRVLTIDEKRKIHVDIYTQYYGDE